MENEFVPKCRWVDKWNVLLEDYLFLAFVAFLFLFFPVIKGVSVLVPAILYTVKCKSVVKFRFALAFVGTYVALYFSKLFYMLCYGTVKNLYFAPVLVFIKIIYFTILEFIFSLILFYVVNLIVTSIIKFFAKNKFTSKLNDFADFLILKKPLIIPAIIIVLIIGINTYDYFTMAKGKFSIIKIYRSQYELITSFTAFDDDKAVIIGKAGNEYEVIDVTKGKSVKNGVVNYIPLAGQKVHSVLINPKNLLIFVKSHNTDDRINLSVLNLDTFVLNDLGQMKVEQNRFYGLDSIGNGEVLLAGGFRDSKQAYVFKDNELIKINDLPLGLSNTKITHFKDDKYFVVGTFNLNNNISEQYIGVLIFDAKTKLFKTVFELKVSANSVIKNVFMLKPDVLAIITKAGLGFGKSSLLLIDTNDFHVISNDEIDYGTSLTGETFTLLDNGKLLITGGSLGRRKYNRQAYIYDDGKITPIKSKMKTKRSGGESVKLNNGKVILYGGLNGEWANEKLDLYTP